MDAHAGATLQFPDAPKLALDDLIEQLVDRARDVQHSQGRLRGLLQAIETVAEDPSLDKTLLNLVEAARALVDARFGAFGVLGPGDDPEQLIQVGVSTSDVADIGRSPEGRGLPGAVIGVPVRVHDQVYGNLRLTDAVSGQFSAEDEALVGALALAAGTAIGNARLLEESRLQQRWLAASVEITSQLISDSGDDPLQVIVRSIIEIADADLVVVTLLTPGSDELVVHAASGQGDSDLPGRRSAVASSRVRSTLELGTPLLLPDDRLERNEDDCFLDGGALMALPLDGPHGVRGVLSVIRARGRQSFHESDLAMAASFAGHASVALELADARLAAQRLVQSEDRARIARNLHDHVIQELYAIGLGLETTATFVEPGSIVGQRIAQRVRDIDRTIRQIRTSIFELRGPLGPSQDGPRARVLQIGADLSDALGFVPQMVFSGLVDLRLDAEVAEDLYACVREMLANVAKHAHATRAAVAVSVSPTALSLVVTDDGVGYTPNGRLSGLGNLQARAARRGGSFDISSTAGRETIATWQAML